MARKRVLLVEDEPTVALLIKESLADQSDRFVVERAASGEEALSFLRNIAWDLVVTDNRMPGITGLELIERLRDQAPATRAILMTAYGSEEVEETARRLKVYHYLTKPFALGDLKHIIQEALALFGEAGKDSQDGSSRTSPDSSPRTPLKVTLGGDGGVGKSSLIRRLCTGQFDLRRCMTIGVEFHIYDMQQSNTSTRLIVWDVSGQDHFAFTRRAFYRGSKGVGLVYDASDRRSFERMGRWHKEIRESLPQVPIVLAGNKTDRPRQVSTEEGHSLADQWRVPFFETSCANGQGVSEFFRALTHCAEQFAHA